MYSTKEETPSGSQAKAISMLTSNSEEKGLCFCDLNTEEGGKKKLSKFQ